MQSIKNFIEKLAEIISEASANRNGYDKMQLIPLPVKTKAQNMPNPNTNNQ